MMELLIEIKDFMDKGGFVMPPLLFLTMLLWYGLGYRFWVLRRSGRYSIRELVRNENGDWQHRPKDIVEEAVRDGFTLKKQAPKNLRKHLDSGFYVYEKEIRKYTALIKIVVAIAPLMGLLGTVTGMIETFDSLAEMALFSQSGGIAGGISQALFTTQMGLSVAIPGVLAKSVLDRKQRRIQAELEQAKDLLCLERLK
ncbi:MotA/TolQ/ExbB proton channel family protein [Methylobacter sp. YRD-M1]|uniref:MotA/TolQ/ExbB proton channel family protein n=1 Tax=Methylobacter sp. YRD-M1 TaxID=2911520 RepID=UPI00227C31FB|nr:MotA/TolQ/ExbB proton channel family protein [Methylobacter sp. YRD-M1]WAK01439.1 MotA/TolQ/ExbB proton channel family protein [Methylobacter sp. YRD-M1]